ncbi:MAG: glycosyltransferase family 39 protein [Oscillospiraceae bacterium]|nr:glycosyltransferase family 39 protein [Oscillospiraceae bacterium]
MNKEKNISLKENPFKGKAAYIILAILIVIQTVMVTYVFSVKKEGFHSDEMWTYGYANSFYRPYIFLDEKTGDISCDRWMDSDEMRDYIIVNEGEQFRFDSVWYNQRGDMHPPLYCSLVHFICSFFPESFSKYYAYVLNFIAMVVGQIYLFKLSKGLFKSDFYGIVACAVWGFSCGFINVNIFLRAYSLMVMLAIMLFYYHYRIYAGEGRDITNFIAIGAIIFSGALIHHYFLVLSFAVCAMFCLYLLVKRNWKRLFIYAGSALASVALSFLCFPQALTHMQNEGPGNGDRLSYRMPLANGIKYCFSLIFTELSGLGMSTYVYPDYAYVIAALVFLIALAIPLCFLFRKETWFISFRTKLVEKLRSFVKNINYIFVMMAVTVFFVVEIVAITVNLNAMLVTSDRYLFFVMPFVVLIAIMFWKYLFEHIKPIAGAAKPVVCIFGACAIFLSNFFSNGTYYFPFTPRGEGGLETIAGDETTYVGVLSSYWLLTVYPYKLMDYESLFITSQDSYLYSADKIAARPVDDKTYVFIDNANLNEGERYKPKYDENGEEIDSPIKYEFDDDSFEDCLKEEDIIEDFETEIYPGYKLQFYGSELVFSRMIHIFKVVPEEEYIDIPIVDAYSEYEEYIAEQKKEQVTLGDD